MIVFVILAESDERPSYHTRPCDTIPDHEGSICVPHTTARIIGQEENHILNLTHERIVLIGLAAIIQQLFLGCKRSCPSIFKDLIKSNPNLPIPRYAP